MTKQNISKARLILNGIGCIGIAALCLPIGLEGVIGLASFPLGTDPDGRDKVLAIETFCGFLGVIAFASLIDTVWKWRRLPNE